MNTFCLCMKALSKVIHLTISPLHNGINYNALLHKVIPLFQTILYYSLKINFKRTNSWLIRMAPWKRQFPLKSLRGIIPSLFLSPVKKLSKCFTFNSRNLSSKKRGHTLFSNDYIWRQVAAEERWKLKAAIKINGSTV